MLIQISSLFVSYLLLIPVFLHTSAKLRHELNYLPENNGSSRVEGSHPSVGLAIPEFIHQNNWFKHSPLIIMVADPHCASCKRELEEMLLYNLGSQKVPVLVFLRDRDDEHTQRYLDFYGTSVDIVLLDASDFLQLNITTNPSYIIMDPNGVIMSVQSHFLFAKKMYTESFLSQKVG